ncbi:hypothetical protein [Domibacillus epiphyticus]|uniref:Uncharacterized protein n=1 Tax=Domibacillus epiphyticus TaxID=1714355 RepID=A0A1V2A5X4_9BACI|nr:hypothetical protein [Domibacillus epiphyticus]OMP66330.1 hypothetical protein BTO28_12770 [Domibacillus epiphyticus]
MSKQIKGLAGFGAVANNKVNNKKETTVSNNKDTNTNDNTIISNDLSTERENVVGSSVNDILDSVTNKPKTIKKRQISAYIDESVAKKLDKFGKEHGKGAKSELINNFLKSVLK